MIVIAAIFSSRMSRTRQQNDLHVCEKNLQSIHLALSFYTLDNRGKFPAMTGAKTSEEPLSLLVPRCTTQTAIFICPGTSDDSLDQGKPFSKETISYAYYMGWPTNAPSTSPLVSDRQVNTASKKQGEQLFSQDGKKEGSNHTKYGGNVLFVGGEVKHSGRKAEFDLTYPNNVTFLQPRK